MSDSSHLDAQGRPRMVDVGDKAPSRRRARAAARVRLGPAASAALAKGAAAKGDVLSVAQLAGISAAKRTGELIPLCHNLVLEHVSLRFELDEAAGSLAIEAEVRGEGKTGVEMEAMTAASVAALTVYDMLKSVDREIRIESVLLLEKSGGKSGHWRRP